MPPLLPTTWESAVRYMLYGEDFLLLPQGNGAQLRKNRDGTITLMFSYRPCVTFSSDGALLLHGPIHSERAPLEGTLDYVESVVRRTGGKRKRVLRHTSDIGVVLLTIPSEDIGLPQGDPYRLDSGHSIRIHPNGDVEGTRWIPFGCNGDTDTCACGWCKGIRKRRLEAIAKAIAGEETT